MNHYELKIEAKRERYAELATKNAALATKQSEAGWNALSLVPFGQPILVGHHSERADRNYRARARGLIEKSIETNEKADYYANKAESVGTAGISSDDPNAISKLKEKLLDLEAKREKYKSMNKMLKAQGANIMPAFHLSNLGANIRSTQKRIKELESRGEMIPKPDVIGKGCILRENKEENRIQFIFEGKPSEEVRSALKRGGFRWSPTNNAWQAFLTNRGRYQAKIITNLINSL